MNKLRLSAFTAMLTTLVLITGCSRSTPSVDLDRVLDVTSKTMDRFSGMQDSSVMEREFVTALQNNLNRANPRIHPESIGVELNADGSIQGYNDANANSSQDEGEKELFKIEIDAEKNRLIASSTEHVREHRFSGTGLIAGLLIGQLLGRQRAAGVNPSSLSNRKTTSNSDYRKARSRSSSGSHSRGK